MLPRQLRSICFVVAITFVASVSAHAQLPFYTDDTDTTPKGKFHVEISNQYDWLQALSLPGKSQSTGVLTVNYGLTNHIELGINGPLIKIFNEPSSGRGDPARIGGLQGLGKERQYADT